MIDIQDFLEKRYISIFFFKIKEKKKEKTLFIINYREEL